MTLKVILQYLGLTLCPFVIVGAVIMFAVGSNYAYERAKIDEPAKLICNNHIVYCDDVPWAPCCENGTIGIIYCHNQDVQSHDVACLDITYECDKLRASVDYVPTIEIILFLRLFSAFLLIAAAVTFIMNAAGLFRSWQKSEKIVEGAGA